MTESAKKVNLALASYPGRGPADAMALALADVASDPWFGPLSVSDVQVCPQNCRRRLDAAGARALREGYPGTRFRLHANARVQERQLPLADLAHAPMYRRYFRDMAEVSRALGAPAYTLHAGVRRKGQRLSELFRNVDALEDLFGIPVGIEGLYPTRSDRYWIADWTEYRALLESGRRFALDLSHVNIVHHVSGVAEDALVREMLASGNCIEVHVSDNDGMADRHRPFGADADPWWRGMLEHVNPDAVVFYEGILGRRRAIGTEDRQTGEA